MEGKAVLAYEHKSSTPVLPQQGDSALSESDLMSESDGNLNTSSVSGGSVVVRRNAHESDVLALPLRGRGLSAFMNLT